MYDIKLSKTVATVLAVTALLCAVGCKKDILPEPENPNAVSYAEITETVEIAVTTAETSSTITTATTKTKTTPATTAPDTTTTEILAANTVVTLNTDILADLGLTYSQITTKRGKLVAGSFYPVYHLRYWFENGYGFHVWELSDFSGDYFIPSCADGYTLVERFPEPPADERCLRIGGVNVKDLFKGLTLPATVANFAKVLPVTYIGWNGHDDAFYITLRYEDKEIYIATNTLVDTGMEIRGWYGEHIQNEEFICEVVLTNDWYNESICNCGAREFRESLTDLLIFKEDCFVMLNFARNRD